MGFEILGPEGLPVYRWTERRMLLPDDVFLPFGGKLNKERWRVKLSQMIPWGNVEEHYVERLKSWTKGQQASSARVALGALIMMVSRDYPFSLSRANIISRAPAVADALT